MDDRQPVIPLRARLTGGVLLVVFLLLNAAVVLPSLHSLWHGDDHGHGCHHADCVVLAVAQGKFESPTAPMPPCRPTEVALSVALPLPDSPLPVPPGAPPAERGPPAGS
jgi:hypothetical protein